MIESRSETALLSLNLLLNIVSLVLVIRNIRKEVGTSVFALVLSPCTSSDSSTRKPANSQSNRRTSQSLTFMGEMVQRKPNQSSNRTHKGTIFINRVVVLGILLNSVAAASDYITKKSSNSSNSKLWMTLVAVQCWLCYGILSHFFFSWVKFLLKLATFDEDRIQTIRICGFAVSFLLNTIVSSLFVLGLHSDALDLCRHSFLLWESFWAVCTSVMLATAIVSAFKTVNLLKVDFKNNSQLEVKKIQRKTVFFSLLCVLILCTFAVAFSFDVSSQLCENKLAKSSQWLSVFVYFTTSTSWMLTVGFNWISSTKSNTASATGVGIAAVESSVSRRQTAGVIDIPKEYLNGGVAEV